MQVKISIVAFMAIKNSAPLGAPLNKYTAML